MIVEVKRVLKPKGSFIFDVIDPESPLAEDWAILETYLGAEVFLTPLSEWHRLIRQAGGKIVKPHVMVALMIIHDASSVDICIPDANW